MKKFLSILILASLIFIFNKRVVLAQNSQDCGNSNLTISISNSNFTARGCASNYFNDVIYLQISCAGTLTEKEISTYGNGGFLLANNQLPGSCQNENEAIFAIFNTDNKVIVNPQTVSLNKTADGKQPTLTFCDQTCNDADGCQCPSSCYLQETDNKLDCGGTDIVDSTKDDGVVEALIGCTTICKDPDGCTCQTSCAEKNQIYPPSNCGGFDTEGDEDNDLNALTTPTNETFSALNPLKLFGNQNSQEFFDSSGNPNPAGLINRALNFLFPIAGMILFIMIFWGGFEMLSGAATKKSMDAGRQRVTAALVGFVILFVAYWLMQIIEIVFGVKIL